MIRIESAIQENVPLSNFISLKIGGPARFFVEVKTEKKLKEALGWAEKKQIPSLIIAGGTNLLVSDSGYEGLVIRINLQGTEAAKNKILVMSGTDLQEFVDFCNLHGIAGFEKLAGIPGTVGGAIYGNAGAYGQTISDHITRVRVYGGEKDFWLTKGDCGFDYRESQIKNRKKLVILEAEFALIKGSPKELKKTSQEIVEKRKEKYPTGIKCPGSFFKNILLANLPKSLQDNLPKDYYGKVPAWYFLEKVGAKGQKRGDIKIADFHANLFINEGGGKASDFFSLAKEYKNKVKEKFGVELEPEVQLIGFREPL